MASARSFTPLSKPDIDGRSSSWFVAILGFWLGMCNIGLLHDLQTLYANEDENVETGMGIESREDFEASVDAAPLGRKLGFIGLGIAGICCFLTIPRGWKLGSLATLIPALCFFAWAVASTLWSMDRGQTIREMIRIAVYIFVAVSIVLRFPARDVVKAIVICLLVSITTCYLGEIALGTFRPWSGTFRMHGSIHSSTLAHHSLVIAIAAGALRFSSSRKLVWQCILIFALVTIVLSKTRGGLFATLVGLATIEMLRFTTARNLFIWSSLATALAFGILIFEAAGPRVWNRVGSAVSLGRSEGVTTLTGRLPLWNVIWNDCVDTRIFGVGYGAFFTTKRTISLAGVLEWFPGHCHNAYLETIVDLGFVGLGILLWLVGAAFLTGIKLGRASGNDVYLYVSALVVAGIIDGFVEVMFISVRDLGLYVGISLSLLMFHNRSDAQRATQSSNFSGSDSIPSQPFHA